MKNTDPDRVPNCEKFAMNFINLKYEYYNKIWLFFYNICSNNGNG